MKNVAPLLIVLAAAASGLAGPGCANRGMKLGEGRPRDGAMEVPAMEAARETAGETAVGDGGGGGGGADGLDGGDAGDRPPMTCPARFNFENGNLHGAYLNNVWKGVTSIAVRDTADGAKTFCGYGSLEITAAFSHADAGADAGGSGDPYVTGEVIIPLNSAMTAENLTGKTITVHVQAVPPDTQNDLAFYALLITSSGYQTLPGYPIKPINTAQFASKSTSLAGADAAADAGIAGMNAVTRLSLELFSYRSYTGKIYVDEIDIQ